jgi:L-seryl-tRNA(Ser) seleniumtransferase
MKENKLTLRDIPSIDKLLIALEKEQDLIGVPRERIVEATRQMIDCLRAGIIAGNEEDTSFSQLISIIKERLLKGLANSLQKVVNGTGVVLHTNIGRAPLSERAQNAIMEILAGYCTLEYDKEKGQRGSRYRHVTDKICALTGAEDAIVVNNNAAAVMLVLSTMAQGREVIVSRGELVEIGGSFRIPDVMRQSGAQLVEVGTTNKTHLYDYERAITGSTAVILKVHTSNYRIIGFTEQPKMEEVAVLAQQKGIPLVEDLGSGTILPPVQRHGVQEPTVKERLANGIDIVTFSGDKLLGASQAGIIAGKRSYIESMKKNPLLRAFRIDKLSLAALEGTLLDYLVGSPLRDIPVLTYLNRPLEELKRQAQELLDQLYNEDIPDWVMKVVPMSSMAGGGTLPGVEFESYGVSVTAPMVGASSLEERLRLNKTPILTRIQAEQVLIDVRCLSKQDMRLIAQAVRDIANNAE